MPPVRSPRRQAVWPCAGLFLAVLSGCATTGDPNQGGLLGWSREKAEQRQVDLTRQSASAQQQSTDAQGSVDALRQKRDRLATESGRQQQELDRLLAENADLDARLRELMQQQNLGDAELARLKKVVAENDKLRRSLATSSQAPRKEDTAAPAGHSGPAQAFGDQNSRLLREITILMQR